MSTKYIYVEMKVLEIVAASAPVAERSVKLRKTNDSQFPQGWDLLCQLLQQPVW